MAPRAERQESGTHSSDPVFRIIEMNLIGQAWRWRRRTARNTL